MNIDGYFCLKKIKHLILLLSLFIGLNLSAQGRLVIDGLIYITIDNQAKLVLENSNSNALINTNNGGIITENEFDQIVWKIGTTTGSYLVPFVSETTLTPIPFTAAIGPAGIGSGAIYFSTYPGSSWDNNTYRPTDVTTMAAAGIGNNSAHVIDRFWIMDAIGYTTKPSAVLNFTYRDSEHTQPGNTIIEANLSAQRFHAGPNTWGDYLPQGITNTTLNSTINVPVSPTDFWRSWTLVESNFPLAIELAYFNSTCIGNQPVLSWQTLLEQQADHFELERMNSNSIFEVIATIPSTGGNGIQNYEYSVTSYNDGVFRLVEVDNNGNHNVLSYLSSDCRNGAENYIAYEPMSNAIILQFDGQAENNETLLLYDASGRMVFKREILIQKGVNTLSVPVSELAAGVYFIQLKNGLDILNGQIIKAY
jgi:hypothetical protein